jgi:uncharacterized membrane protein YpjA
MKPRDLFIPLILINIFAVAAGAYYYSGQLAATPPHLLIFVPDCPLYVLLFIPIALGIIKNKVFSFLVSVGMVKYGLWTVFVLLFHSDAYFQPYMLPVTLIFIAGHMGMVAEGVSALPKKRIGALALAIVIGWFLLNDYMDYAVGTVPPIPADGMWLVAALTIASSIAIPLLFAGFARNAYSVFPFSLIRGATRQA